MAEALEQPSASPPDRPLLPVEGVRLGCTAVDRADAVRQAGEVLIELGAVQPAYAEAMQEREQSLSSFVGEAFAIPHGTDEARSLVHHAALAFLQFPAGVDWDGEEVRACIGIAATQDEHVGVLSRLARILVVPEQAEELRTADDPRKVVALLDPDHAPEKETL